MKDIVRRSFVVLAVLAAVAGGGYLLVDNIGLDGALEVMGFEVSEVVSAPDSQCNRARAQGSDDETIACMADGKWLRRFYEECARGEKESSLAYVDEDGALTRMDACPVEVREEARKLSKEPIPSGYRVADAVANLDQ